MKKQTLLILLSALLACTPLTGCGSKEEEVAPTVTDVSEAKPEEEPEEEPEEPEEEPVEEPVPEGMYRSELTNEVIDESLKNQRPIAVMVDNEKTALDHYGLNQADIIYEMMNSTANDYITRFMCIVKDYDAITQFGSIRSVRPTNFMLAPEYNAIVCHDGGPFYINPFLENPWVDHFSGTFSRVKNGKPREFTEYILPGDMDKNFKNNSKISREYNDYYPGPHFIFAAGGNDLSEASDAVDATLIDLPFKHNGSQLDYDEATGLYMYSEYNMKHIDPANNNEQLSFTNLILQCAEHHQYDDHGYMQFNLVNNSGEGYFITGGKAIPITWSKGHDCDPTQYLDASGNPIELNTGKTYIGIVSTKQWPDLVIE